MATLYGYVSNTGAPEYDDILNSDLPKEEKVKQIKMRGQQYEDEINRGAMLDNIRMGLGTLVSGASFHPILNIPYVGTGLGGAMYDLGQGIVEGDKARDLVKRAARGAAIGAVIPPAAKKLAATKAGQAVGKQLTKVAEKAAENPTVQKAYDALMTDIKAFNPNKQTVYHGSPYDFNKFSNEAIGTGEGAQAHGYGHYAALDKDTAEAYAKNLSEGNKVIEYNGKIYKSNAEFKPNEYNYKMLSDVKTDGLEAAKNFYKDQEQWAREKLAKSNDKKWWEDTVKAAEGTNKLLDTVNPSLISDIRPDTGQLYKLSIPKDDVMLREDLPFSEQPKAVQDALQKIANKQGKWGNKEYLNFWEIPEDEFYNQAIKGNATGKEIQNLINNYAKDNFAATSILRDNGIKGISYNGGIDGEARVIFNPDDIDIVRKYYNQSSLADYLVNNSVLTKGYRTNKETIDKALLNSKRKLDIGLNPFTKTESKVLYDEVSDNLNIKKAEEVLENDIKRHLNGEMGRNEHINFGNPSLFLQNYGVPNLPMKMPQAKFDATTNRKSYKGHIHNVPDNIVKKIPTLLQKPKMIMKSPNFEDTRYVIQVNKTDANGNPIIVILDYDSATRDFNLIPSIYGKEEFEKYCIRNAKNILYKK